VTRQSCIILAGGLGTRLRSVVADVPKCLAPVRGRPFLHWQIDSLCARGIDHVLLALGHGAAMVEAAVAGLAPGLAIDCVTEPSPLGTGGAIAFALDAAGLDEALVANGDTFLGGDLAPMLAPLDRAAGERLRIAVTAVPDRGRFGGVEVGATGRVQRFVEKGTHGPGNINAGLYRVRRDAMPPGHVGAFSLESEIFPALAAKAALFAVEVAGPFIDIGVPDDYRRYCDDHDQYR